MEATTPTAGGEPTFETVMLILASGHQMGPMPRSEVLPLIASGKLPPGTLLQDTATGAYRRLADFPDLAAAAPVDLVSRMIPRNTYALIGYYLGVFSFLGIPFFCVPGVLMGLGAIVLGILGLRAFREDPLRRGKGHSLTAIILGSLCLLITVALVLLVAWRR